MSNVTREEMKLEAIKRMNTLKIFDETVELFEKNDIISYSDFNGIIFWADEELLNYVKKFEEKFNCLVYHVIKSYTEFGILYSMLYVSDNKDEWELDCEGFSENLAFAYVYNETDDWCSEFGTIGFRNQWGGLIRTT